MFLFPDDKVEIKLKSYKDYRMAELIAHRLHRVANSKKLRPDHYKLGLRFVISQHDGWVDLYIASTKLRALDSRTVYDYNQLARSYEAILQPFFSKR